MRPEQLNEWVTLYEGDCMDVLPRLLVGKIDAFFTSPPYNLGGEPWPHLGNWNPGDSAGGKSKWRNGSDAGNGIQYNTHEDSMSWEEYCRWQRSVVSLMWNAISDNGAIFYNHKPRVIGARLWTPFELIPPNVILRQIITWARSGGLNFNPTAYLPTSEWVMMFAKPGFRLKSRGASGVGDVWRVNQDPSNNHPAPFPVQLPCNAMDTTIAEVWCDPFAGSGTTGIAAMLTGRKCILIEKDAKYCEVIRKRVCEADAASPGKLFAPQNDVTLFDHVQA